MSAEGPSITGSGDVPTVLVRDDHDRQLLCFLEQLIPLDGHDYALLTPVDTPVCLFRLQGDRSGRLDSAAAALLLDQWLREGPPAVPVPPATISHGAMAAADPS